MNIIARLFLYLFGTLRLRLSGDYCERMLNIMATRNIAFWRPKKSGNDVYLTIKMSDFKSVKAIRKNTDVKIKIIKKKGFPLIANRYKKRYGLLIGIIAFVIVLNILASKLWIIKLKGNTNVTDKDINDFFINNEVVSGTTMSEINSDILKQKLIIDFDNIAWASINKQGSVIEVNLSEFSTGIPKDNPCNVVSNNDAVIKRINVSKGSVKVKIGDTVTKNQMLVSGVVDFGAGCVFVHSEGEILGEIREEMTFKIPKLKKELSYTKNSKKRYVLNLMGIKIPLYLGSVKGNYFITERNERLRMFGGEIPISLTCRSFGFYTESTHSITEGQAKSLSVDYLNKWSKENNCEAFEYTLKNTYEDKNYYVFIYDTVFIRDIGINTPLIIE